MDGVLEQERVRRRNAEEDKHDVVNHEQRVDAGQRPQTHSGDLKVLMDEQQDKPNADNEAFLNEECAVAEFQNPRHHGVPFTPPSLNPHHGEQRVEDIEQQNEDHERHVDGGEAVYVCVRLFAGSAAPFSVSMTEERGPRRSGLLATIAAFSSVDYGPRAA